MIPIDIQVSMSKVKIKGHASLLHLVQLITQERFAPEASNLVSRQSLMSTWPLLIFRSVGQRSVSKVKPILYMLGKGGISVLQTAIFHICIGKLLLLWLHTAMRARRKQNLQISRSYKRLHPILIWIFTTFTIHVYRWILTKVSIFHQRY